MYWQPRMIYPNQYIVLIGPSGRSRKGEAINLGLDIIRHVEEVNFASASMTREALIQTMIESEKTYEDKTSGNPVTQCAIYCVSEELSVFLGQRDIKFLADLTDWYDSRDLWSYRTRSRGTEEISGVCLNLLGASAPDWLGSIFPAEAVGGGFTSRCILVVERNKGKIIADPTKFEFDLKLRDNLLHDLNKITELNGEFRFTTEAKEEYVRWYTSQEEGLKRGISPVPDSRFGGYVSRRATHIKKVSMALSASRGSDLIVNKNDFTRAVKILTTAEKNMASAFETVGEGKYTKQTSEVIMFIKEKKEVTRSQILRRFYADVDSWTFEKIEILIRQMRMVIVTDQADGDRRYTYVEKKDD